METKICPVYEYWMNIEEPSLSVGDRVGVFYAVHPNGKVIFYGWGIYTGLVHEPLNPVGNGFYDESIGQESKEVYIDNDSKITSKDAFFMSEKVTEELLFLAKNVTHIRLPYLDIKEEYDGSKTT